MSPPPPPPPTDGGWPEAKGYCDLNIPVAFIDGRYEEADIKPRLLRAIQLGYTTLALNVTIQQEQMTYKAAGGAAKKAKKADEETDAEVSGAQAKKAKLSSDALETMTDFPPAPCISLTEAELSGLPCQHPVLLTRLTLAFTDNTIVAFCNKSATLGQYDLLSVRPTSTDALLSLLKTNFRADLVAFCPAEHADLRWQRKLYTECIEKHMHFELNYAPMIRDAGDRRKTITQGHTYHMAGKSRCVLLSSGALNPMELRGPADVANLGFLLGLDEHLGKLAVGRMPREAVRAAAGKKVGPYRALVQKVDSLKEDEKWKVPAKVKDDGEDVTEEEGEEEEETCVKSSPTDV